MRTPADRLLATAGPTMSLPNAAKILGISRGHCYQLARAGGLPVRVLRLGGRMVVPTAELRRAVGLAAQQPAEPMGAA